MNLTMFSTAVELILAGALGSLSVREELGAVWKREDEEGGEADGSSSVADRGLLSSQVQGRLLHRE